MKRGRFTEEQIIAVLREMRLGRRPASGAQARHLGSHPVQLEGQVWRPGCVGGQRALSDTYAGIAPAGVLAFIVARIVGGSPRYSLPAGYGDRSVALGH
jgi:hypothetical protein